MQGVRAECPCATESPPQRPHFFSLVSDDFRELGPNVHQIDLATRNSKGILFPCSDWNGFELRWTPQSRGMGITDSRLFCRTEPDSVLA